MERNLKYVFDAENWKPKLASDGRPRSTWLFDSWGDAFKTWRKESRDAQLSAVQSLQALNDILKATNAKNNAQQEAWYKSRTKEELWEMAIPRGQMH